jgi:hypothetical protein
MDVFRKMKRVYYTDDLYIDYTEEEYRKLEEVKKTSVPKKWGKLCLGERDRRYLRDGNQEVLGEIWRALTL